MPPLPGLASPQHTRPWGARTGKLCHLFHIWPSQVHPGPGAPCQGSYTPTSMANFSRPVYSLRCHTWKDVTPLPFLASTGSDSVLGARSGSYSLSFMPDLHTAGQVLGCQIMENTSPLEWVASLVPTRSWGARQIKLQPFFNDWPPKGWTDPSVPGREICGTLSRLPAREMCTLFHNCPLKGYSGYGVLGLGRCAHSFTTVRQGNCAPSSRDEFPVPTSP